MVSCRATYDPRYLEAYCHVARGLPRRGPDTITIRVTFDGHFFELVARKSDRALPTVMMACEHRFERIYPRCSFVAGNGDVWVKFNTQGVRDMRATFFSLGATDDSFFNVHVRIRGGSTTGPPATKDWGDATYLQKQQRPVAVAARNSAVDNNRSGNPASAHCPRQAQTRLASLLSRAWRRRAVYRSYWLLAGGLD